MKCIEETIQKTQGFGEILAQIRGGSLPCSVFGVTEEAKAQVARAVYLECKRPVFYVVANDYRAKQLSESIPGSIYLPTPQVEFRTIEAKGNEIALKRIAAMRRLSKKNSLTFLSVRALLFKMRPKEHFESLIWKLDKGQSIEPEELKRRLAEAGYERCDMIEGAGQWSGRGEILEVYTPQYEAPIRITFFDDEIESIRYFDTDTQRSYGDPLSTAEVLPAAEIQLLPEERKAFCAYLRQQAPDTLQQAAENYCMQAEQFGHFENIEAFAGVLNEPQTILDYVKNPVVLWNGAAEIQAEYDRGKQEEDKLFAEVFASGEAFGCERDVAFSLEHIAQRRDWIDLETIQKNPWIGERNRIALSIRSAVSFAGKQDFLIESLKRRIQTGYMVYLFAGSRAKRLQEWLEEEGVSTVISRGESRETPGISIVNAYLAAGFEIEEKKAYFLGEKELYGKIKGKRERRRKKKNAAEFFADLKIGDIVVHDAHGKGRYLGLKTMEVGGVSSEYMELEYRGGDRLFVQTSQIDRVQKYIGPGDTTDMRLSKLGGKEWENAKDKARKSVKQMAEDLVSIYREREQRHGFQFSPDTVWQRQFEENFEYEETPGQRDCIRQIKRDMQSKHIMDRLLMGDVGYGKTEVAMRACFKAVMDSKQVAVLVPTTLLARQHFITFKERFAGFPVKIGMLSRFSDHNEKTIADIAAGNIDIVIGTHRLLSKDVVFKDLGLLVIDEEQRFGVSHKERMKDIKRTVDVLTLSATPIPRTLEMAMTGIRDMSTIDTPPSQRKEVQAFVSEFDWNLVREAILKELSRGGQVYFVCRQINQMDTLMRELAKAVPEARINMAHGQLSESEFEQVISSFYEREFDVLLCTTIIESGIDIPSVNTIIIYEADKFGLSQLYQLKGRIGRSSVLAYAYFTYLKGQNMSELAQKRLGAIREFTRFGSGFKIAMRDLEIRGAGNILGPEQSGHMAQVGYSLYCSFVQSEVAQVMGKNRPKPVETAVEFGKNTFIPDFYIPDEAQKLEIYRSIAAIHNVDGAKEMREELKERYGALPKEVENLIAVSLIRAFAQRAGISSVIRKKDILEMKFDERTQIHLQRLVAVLEGYSGKATLRASNPPVILFTARAKRLFTESLELLSQIRRCITIEDTV